MKIKRVHLKVGDVFEIPLSNGKKGYGQYILRDPKSGMLIQVFDKITDTLISLDELVDAKQLFPPLYTGLQAAVRVGLWRVIGHMPVKNFTYPLFVSPFIDGSIENIRHWSLWDGNKYTRLGHPLPEKYKNLEIYLVWSPYDIAVRIEKGKNPIANWYAK